VILEVEIMAAETSTLFDPFKQAIDSALNDIHRISEEVDSKISKFTKKKDEEEVEESQTMTSESEGQEGGDIAITDDTKMDCGATQPLLPPTMIPQSSLLSNTANDNANRCSRSYNTVTVFVVLIGILVSGFLSRQHHSSSSPVIRVEVEFPSSVPNSFINVSSESEDDTESKSSISSSRKRFWKHIQDTKSGLLGEDEEDEDEYYDYYNDMELCLKNKQSESTLLKEEEETQAAHQQPVIVDTVQDKNNRTILVEISNAITPSQAQAVKDLASCTRRYFPSRFDERAFDGTGGGNEVTFINILLQLFLPDLALSMDHVTEMAYNHARWGSSGDIDLPEPSTCGLRTSEYLDYGKFKGLGGHRDTGSLYTVLFALSDPKMYKGGEYFIRPRVEKMIKSRVYYIKPRQYSVIVFLSDTYHGVTDIESGVREMFTNEYWEYDDPPWHSSLRPEVNDMELYMKKCDRLFPVDYYTKDKIDGRREYYESCGDYYDSSDDSSDDYHSSSDD